MNQFILIYALYFLSNLIKLIYWGKATDLMCLLVHSEQGKINNLPLNVSFALEIKLALQEAWLHLSRPCSITE